MRVLFMFFALLVMVIPPAQATENRILSGDMHNFISQVNTAINNPNIHTSREFLERAIASNALFENRVSVYNNNYYNGWNQVWYQNPATGVYYRYPANPNYSKTGLHKLKKWDHINMVQNRKRSIPGYRAHMEITNTTVNPYGQSAVIDVDMKEYSLSYTPYTPTLSTQILHANSKCKMYVKKTGNKDLLVTRMDCNTNTNLPL